MISGPVGTSSDIASKRTYFTTLFKYDQKLRRRSGKADPDSEILFWIDKRRMCLHRFGSLMSYVLPLAFLLRISDLIIRGVIMSLFLFLFEELSHVIGHIDVFIIGVKASLLNFLAGQISKIYRINYVNHFLQAFCNISVRPFWIFHSITIVESIFCICFHPDEPFIIYPGPSSSSHASWSLDITTSEYTGNTIDRLFSEKHDTVKKRLIEAVLCRFQDLEGFSRKTFKKRHSIICIIIWKNLSVLKNSLKSTG